MARLEARHLSHVTALTKVVGTQGRLLQKGGAKPDADLGAPWQYHDPVQNTCESLAHGGI